MYSSRYDIWCSGEPEPDVIWERKGCNINQDESGRITVEEFLKNGVYCEKNSVVTVTKASRSEDTGDWRVRLMCGGGSTEATGHVNVIDVPRAPRCLNLDEVRAEYCWTIIVIVIAVVIIR